MHANEAPPRRAGTILLREAIGMAPRGLGRGAARFLAIAMLVALGLLAGVLAGSDTAMAASISCQDVTLAATNVRSETESTHANFDAGTCIRVAQGTSAAYNSGFSLQAYTEAPVAVTTALWVLPSSIINGSGFRFNNSNPVKCTGTGCGVWARGDYAICYPLVGACQVTASYTYSGYPTTLTATVPAGEYKITNISVSYEQTVIPPSPYMPAFLGTQADIDLTVDYPGIDAVATWTAPKATLNSQSVPVTQTAGLPPGSRFPLGTTTVTYQADAGSGNVKAQSFAVRVSQRQAGSVTFVLSAPADRAATFTSSERALNVVVTARGGGGSSGAIPLPPGTYDFRFSVPGDLGIASASCSTGSRIDASARTGTITLGAGDAVTCTLTVLNSVRDTVALLSAIGAVRGQMALSFEPDLQRRLDRLAGRIRGGEISGFGMAYASQTLPLSLQVNTDGGSFALSLRDAQGKTEPVAATEALAGAGLVTDVDQGESLGQNFDIWLEGKYAKYDAAGGKGNFAALQGGIDYILADGLLVGLGAQLDWIDLNKPAGVGAANGLGLMVGPYLTASLGQGLYFDARAAFGVSQNVISPYGTYSDTTMGRRGLVTAALGGEMTVGALEIRPEARLSWYRELIAGYTDSLNVKIPDVATETGTLTFGPTFRLPYEVGNGVVLAPFARVNGIWTLVENNTAAGQPGVSTANLRAAVELGFDLDTLGGFAVSAAATYDGIGTQDYRALGGNVSIGQKF